MEEYSVLMSVYYKEKPEFLREAIQSIMNQTVRTNDFVIVCDGPLTPELDNVLMHFGQEFPNVFNIVRLRKNVGIGVATNIGLQHCKNDLIAKMDADDISVQNRCEMQLQRFEECPHLTILGGMIEEFEDSDKTPLALRIVPEENDSIRKFARRRQPFNNVTVMYRQQAVLAVGGYRDFRRNEDYDLYIRLLKAGYYAENLPQILVHVRVDGCAKSRRASLETLKNCIRSRWYAFRIGYSSLWDFIVCIVGETVIVCSPRKIQHFIYSNFLRKKT